MSTIYYDEETGQVFEDAKAAAVGIGRTLQRVYQRRLWIEGVWVIERRGTKNPGLPWQVRRRHQAHQRAEPSPAASPGRGARGLQNSLRRLYPLAYPGKGDE